MQVNIDTDKLTRVVVVDHSTDPHDPNEKFGRVFEQWNISVSLSVQDGGRTLKVFVDDAVKL